MAGSGRRYAPEFKARMVELVRAGRSPEVSAKAKRRRHGGIGLLTPAQVHFGHAPEVIRQRQDVLAAAYAARPERFVAGPPRASELPAQVWINPPLPVSAVDGEDRTADGEGDDGKEGPLH